MQRKVFLISLSLVAMAMTSCGEKPAPTPSEYQVTSLNEEVIIAKEKAKANEDFSTSLYLSSKAQKENFILPNTLKSVTIGGVLTNEYTYQLDESLVTASIQIPGAYITGDIVIDVTLEKKPVLTEYTIAQSLEEGQHSTITFNSQVAKEGDTVIGTIVPEFGYYLKDTEVSAITDGASPAIIEVTYHSGDKGFSFKVPTDLADDVTTIFVKAVCQKEPPAPSIYAIEQSTDPAQHSTLTFSKDEARADETVTGTITPYFGYTLVGVTIDATTDGASPRSIMVTHVGRDSAFSLKVPTDLASDVNKIIVKAICQKEPEPPVPGTYNVVQSLDDDQHCKLYFASSSVEAGDMVKGSISPNAGYYLVGAKMSAITDGTPTVIEVAYTSGDSGFSFIVPASLASDVTKIIVKAVCQKIPEPSEYSASLTGTDAMELTNDTAIEGENYQTNIVIKDIYKSYCTMPDALIEVKVNGSPLVSTVGYFYNFNEEDHLSASLTILADYVTGNIVINAKANANSVEVKVNDANEKISSDVTSVTIGSGLSTTLRIKDSDYALPDNLDDSTIIEESSTVDLTHLCTYQKIDRHTATLKIPATYQTEQGEFAVIRNNVIINMNSIYDIVTIKNGTLNNLVTNVVGEVSIPKLVNYSFTIEVTEEAQATHIIPDELDIKVGATSLKRGNYTITPDATNPTLKATVFIYGYNITDNIEVSGSATQTADTYKVTKVGYHVTIAGEDTAIEGSNYVATLSPEGGHDAPTSDNVRVYIGNIDDIKVNDWLIPNVSDGVTYNNGTLTLDSSVVTNQIVIVSCAPDVSLLEELSWEEISEISDAGYAPYLFEIGEETAEFTIEGYAHTFTARILDFNRDAKEAKTKNPAGITFEFTSCLEYMPFSSADNKDQDTYYYEDFFTEKVYTSDMYNKLNNEIYSKLPFKNYIKQVTKNTLTGTKGGDDTKASEVEESPNYLFPLSLKEMDAIPQQWMSAYEKEVPYYAPEKAEYQNQPYAYYKGRTQTVPDILKKKLGNDYVNYWLRSPATDIRTPNIYGYHTDNDKMLQFNCRMENSAIAPAFCI